SAYGSATAGSRAFTGCAPRRSHSAVSSAPSSGACIYRTQAAVLLAQFARAADTARLALAYIGATVLVVDPSMSELPRCGGSASASKTPSNTCRATPGCADSG